MSLLLIGAGVFALTLGVSLAIFFASLAAEQRSAATQFAAAADDLASKLLYDTLAHARDVRVIAERVGVFTEVGGGIPSRMGYARFCEPFRADPSRLFTGLSLAINISAADRSTFEATLTAENGLPKTLYSPIGGPVKPSTWWITNAYTNTGAEAAKGFDKVRPAWTWSDYPDFLDVERCVHIIMISEPARPLASSMTRWSRHSYQAPRTLKGRSTSPHRTAVAAAMSVAAHHPLAS